MLIEAEAGGQQRAGSGRQAAEVEELAERGNRGGPGRLMLA